MTILKDNPPAPSHAKWAESAELWKDLDDMRLLTEAMEIILLNVGLSSNSVTDTPDQRAARLMQIELKRRMSGNKSQEQTLRESLELILRNAEGLMPAYKSEKLLRDYMAVTKNPLLKNTYAIREHCRLVLDVSDDSSNTDDPDIA